jgi:hypothetical protein
MTKLYKINSFYVKTKYKYHKSIKEKFLELIKQAPAEKYDDIARTDWTFKSYKTYQRFFEYHFMETIEKIGKKFKSSEPVIKTLWFQQYHTNDTHTWHIHNNASYSNVYFLELPDTEFQTEFFNILTNKPYKNFKLKEGDIVTFSGNLPHRSKKMLSKKRKTSIVFNVDYQKLHVRY